MKRNMLLAFLVTIAATTATLAGASPGSAGDVECRYAIKPPPAPSPQPLVPNHVVHISGVVTGDPYHAPFEQLPQWSVVGVRPAAGTNYDLAIRDCGSGVVRATSVLPSVLVDFVAFDGNRPLASTMFASISKRGDLTGTFALEYNAGGPALVRGVPQALLIRGTPALVRDVYVPGGTTTTILLRLTSGDADLAAVDSASTSDTWVRSRVQAIQHSVQPGLIEERITLSVPAGAPGRTFGLVVVNNAPLTEATLLRS